MTSPLQLCPVFCTFWGFAFHDDRLRRKNKSSSSASRSSPELLLDRC